MAFGYEIYAPDGSLLTSSSQATGIILGSVEIGAGNQSGSLTAADLARGTPFVWFVPPNGVPGGTPTVTFSGTTMTWTAPATGTYYGRLWYGVR